MIGTRQTSRRASAAAGAGVNRVGVSGVPRVLLAVDPATRSGWARFTNGRLTEFGVVEPTSGATVAGLRAGITTGLLRREAGDALLVVEEHSHPRSRLTARRLAEARRTWEVIAEYLGWRVERVNAQEWQGKMLGSGTSATRKRRAQAVAWDTLVKVGLWPLPSRLEEVNEDVADAIALGLYWLRRATLEGAP